MKFVYKRIAQFPKKQKATRVRFEHYIGRTLIMQLVLYGIDFPSALNRFKQMLDLKVGIVNITALYGESRLCDATVRVNEILDHYAAADMLLY